MISGRGLAHTVARSTKLEAIPASTEPIAERISPRSFVNAAWALSGRPQRLLLPTKKSTRCVMLLQQSRISVICASIMSKENSRSIDALVLDVKTGSGAFMKKRQIRFASPRSCGYRGSAWAKKSSRHHRHGATARPHGRPFDTKSPSRSRSSKGRGPADCAN